MSHDQDKKEKLDVAGDKQIRRTFLKRASAGALIASIPAKSVWANGITASIVASGHGSDWNDGKCTQLLSPGFWKGNGNVNVWSSLHDLSFEAVFGGRPLRSGGQTYNDFNLLDVISSPGGDGGNGPDGLHKGKLQLGGPSNINFMLVAMFLNAEYSGSFGIYYPIADQSFNGDATAFAKHIYDEAAKSQNDTIAMAELLSAMITTFHVGGDLAGLPPYDDSILNGYYSGNCVV